MTRKTKGGARPSKVDLLPGEEIEFHNIEPKREASDEELNSRYVKGEIRIVTESARYSLAGIRSMLEERVDGELRYKLDPEYQRRHRWSIERKSRLIESFLINVPVPPVFLYERDLARFEVMDGRQRLTALSEFYSDKFELTDLTYWPELNGRTYSNLPSKVRDGIDRRYISSIILLKETASNEEDAANLKKLVFERLNSGGVKLSGQEARNAVYDGPLNQLCLKLSENPLFKKMWGIPDEIVPGASDDEQADERDEPTNIGRSMFEKMEDVEMVLRFFAYRQLESVPGGLNKISAVLDRFLVKGNRFPPEILVAYKGMFESTVSLLWELLGAQAFHRMDRGAKPKDRPTKIVYDPLMLAAARHSEEPDRSKLLENKGVLAGELGRMYSEQKALFSGRRTNAADTEQRDRHVAAAFARSLGRPTP
jgi:hypothetical protein